MVSFVLAGLAGLPFSHLQSAGRDCQRSQQSSPQRWCARYAQNRHDFRAQPSFRPHRDQQENHGDYRPVDEQQHNKITAIVTMVILLLLWCISAASGWSGHSLYARRGVLTMAYCLDFGQRRSLPQSDIEHARHARGVSGSPINLGHFFASCFLIGPTINCNTYGQRSLRG